jgi:hypothetical protein
MKVILLIAISLCSAKLQAADRPSKEAESISTSTAHQEVEENSKLSRQGVYDAYRCEVFFYSNLIDADNFGELTEQEKKELKPILGRSSFFLHRFTSKTGKEEIREVFISEDGKIILHKRLRKKP